MKALTQLYEIARGRDHISTREFAIAIRKAAQTIRKHHCLRGECFGIRPVKIGNALLWPVSEVAALLSGEVRSDRWRTRRREREGV